MSSELKGKKVLAIIGGTELLGSERGTLEALLSLHRQGASIVVGVSGREKDGGAVGAQARSFGFETFNLPYGSHFHYRWMIDDRGYRWRQIKRLWTNSRCLSRAIHTHRPTHLMNSSVLAYIFCFLAFQWHRLPLIYRMGDAPVTESQFQMFFWRSLVRRSKTIVTISEYIKLQVFRFAPMATPKCLVIHNKVITRTTPANGLEIKALKTAKKEVQLVYVGNITEQKGVPLLIQAVLEINDPALGLWIVGGGEHSRDLEDSLKSSTSLSKSASEIKFFGYQDNPTPFFSCADWHIAPSTSAEALGNVVQEAKNAGTPSIVSPIGGLPELIEDGVDGLIMARVDAREIQDTIEALQKNTFNASQFGIRAKNSLQNLCGEEKFDTLWHKALTR
jgi:glycosyltransferase involved in cell wall biosynthesis